MLAERCKAVLQTSLIFDLEVKVVDLLCVLLLPIADVERPGRGVKLIETERVEHDLHSLLHFLFND